MVRLFQSVGLTLLAMVLTALAGGCTTAGLNHVIEDSMANSLPEPALDRIDFARSEIQRARDARDRAEQGLFQTLQSLRDVNAELNRAQIENERARTQLDVARVGRDQEAIARAENTSMLSSAKVEEKVRKITLYERRVEMARAWLNVSELDILHKEALFELAKAQELSNHPGGPRIELEPFELQANEIGARIARESQLVARAGIEVEAAEWAWRDALARVEALTSESAL